jgi:hypothetical protein
MTLKHSRLAHALMALRPGSKPLVDFKVVDHGNGPELVEGSMINPPTQKEIDAVSPADLDAAQAKKNPGRAVREMLDALAPEEFAAVLKISLGAKRAAAIAAKVGITIT